jgi:hypothetical protein
VMPGAYAQALVSAPLGAVMMIRASAAAGAVGIAFAISGCAASDPIADCLAKEWSGYPALKAVAAQTMPKSAVIRFPDRSGMNCEDSLTPRPGATAIMREWRTRQEAISYLRAKGWRAVDDSGSLANPDGTISASATHTILANGKSYIYVLFKPRSS